MHDENEKKRFASDAPLIKDSRDLLIRDITSTMSASSDNSRGAEYKAKAHSSANNVKRTFLISVTFI